jgi:hypothetical protein
MAGTLTISTLSDGTNSTSATNCIQGSAKAWVRFNGGATNTAGTILASYNVSSITVNGNGDFTINFTNAFADANYSLIGTAKKGTNQSTQSVPEVIQGYFNQSYATTNARINCIASGGGPDIIESVSVAIFR